MCVHFVILVGELDHNHLLSMFVCVCASVFVCDVSVTASPEDVYEQLAESPE